MFQLAALTKFQTKKKLSDTSTWVAWSAILTVGIVLSIILSLIHLRTFTDDRVRFVNIRIPAIDNNLLPNTNDNLIVSQATPLLFLGKDNVILGSTKSVIAPEPNSDVLLVKRINWEKSLIEQLITWRRGKELFPTQIINIAVDPLINGQEFIKNIAIATDLITQINKKFGKELVPQVLIVNLSLPKAENLQQKEHN